MTDFSGKDGKHLMKKFDAAMMMMCMCGMCMCMPRRANFGSMLSA